MIQKKMLRDFSEDELFSVVPYNREKSDDVSEKRYSYWKSVFYNFTKKKVTLVMIAVFIILLVMSFVPVLPFAFAVIV